ncbi:NAD(P)H-dependent oxidoreductase [Streptomyces calvus]|uniref:NAD(P)H-dependent oxidoreductase n=1 Tax=Streptomyces calvus TaxID=67282 RepID=UPI001E5C8FD4|nr:NAD(P)H-dependent oxidoreductase [Streptomyces calvus]
MPGLPHCGRPSTARRPAHPHHSSTSVLHPTGAVNAHPAGRRQPGPPVPDASRVQPGSTETADLAAEQSDPRFTPADRRTYREKGNYPADIVAGHRRLEQATDLVLVFPVYWWSMPALLKGWIDRVFVNGWAFEHSPASGLQPKLHNLTTHILPITGDDCSAYQRHGYESALRTQIEHGITDYCGSRHSSTAFIYESEQPTPTATVRGVDHAVRTISQATHGRLTP